MEYSHRYPIHPTQDYREATAYVLSVLATLPALAVIGLVDVHYLYWLVR